MTEAPPVVPPPVLTGVVRVAERELASRLAVAMVEGAGLPVIDPTSLCVPCGSVEIARADEEVAERVAQVSVGIARRILAMTERDVALPGRRVVPEPEPAGNRPP